MSTTYEFDAAISSAVEADGAKPAAAEGQAEAPGLEEISGPLSPELLDKMQRYWQAANYLTVGQIYLQANPLLREPLRPEHIKPRLLGHWGTSPGLSFIYVHLNRLIQRARCRHDLPGRPGPRRPGHRRQRLPGRHLFADLPGDHAGRGRACGGCSASSRRPAASPATSA